MLSAIAKKELLQTSPALSYEDNASLSKLSSLLREEKYLKDIFTPSTYVCRQEPFLFLCGWHVKFQCSLHISFHLLESSNISGVFK